MSNVGPSVSPIRNKQPILPGFRPSPRTKRRPIPQMTVRELQDLYNLNKKILGSPGASTSTYVQRVLAEQVAIESRLIEVDGMEALNTGLKRTKIKGEGDMDVDIDEFPEPATSRTIEAKRKALAKYGPGFSTTGSINMQEAIELERQVHIQDQERQLRMQEKKKRLGMPIKGEVLSREEQEARIWAFMNHKPTESDLEDDDDDDDDDDNDPATWFEDDQDDGRKGQDIVEPDYDDFGDIIRVDESKIRSGHFYEPRDEGE